MSLEQVVKYFNMRDLTGEEIQNLTGKPPVMYSDLPKYKTLDALLGKEKHSIILYQTSSKTTGHFVAITANDYDGTIRYCESYGYSPEQVRTMTPFDDPFPTYIINLLAPYKVEYNKFDFQAKKKGVSTCGRWASIFCRLRNVPLSRIIQMVSTNKSEFLRDYDNIATILTLLGLDDIETFIDGKRV
jgi:hypothetical protein